MKLKTFKTESDFSQMNSDPFERGWNPFWIFKSFRSFLEKFINYLCQKSEFRVWNFTKFTIYSDDLNESLQNDFKLIKNKERGIYSCITKAYAICIRPVLHPVYPNVAYLTLRSKGGFCTFAAVPLISSWIRANKIVGCQSYGNDTANKCTVRWLVEDTKNCCVWALQITFDFRPFL